MNSIIKAVFYKEWIKTKLVFWLFMAISIAYLLYNIGIWYRVDTVKGAGHLWDIVLSRDTIFIQNFRFVPIAFGAILALFQYTPEMRERRLKLTLHLPVNHTKMTWMMLSYGAFIYGMYTLLLMAFTASAAWYYFPSEIIARIIATTFVWFIAGLCSYFLTSRIVLEETRKYSIIHFLISLMIIAIFFINDIPGSYTSFIPQAIVLCLFTATWTIFSIDRFKYGVRD